MKDKQESEIEIDKEEKQKIENEVLVDSETLLKKRSLDDIENIDNIERKKKKENIDNDEINQSNDFENKNFNETISIKKIKNVSTSERTTLASLSSDRQTPVLEALRGRLINIERSCKY